MAEKHGPPTRKALRKMRRRAENYFYAKDARFWMGKLKSADRMQYDRPAIAARSRSCTQRFCWHRLTKER